jgi:hypothetical protein
VCNEPIEKIDHVGVRCSTNSNGKSGIHHFAYPCLHNIALKTTPSKAALAVYNGGPLWKKGFKWVNVYWGSYWSKSPTIAPSAVDKAVINITTNTSYWGDLSEYNVGSNDATSGLVSQVMLTDDPPAAIDDSQIQTRLTSLIKNGTVVDLKGAGAYNFFFPPGVTVALQNTNSCSYFCDYHNAISQNGPFYTVEPWPCSSGCNQCTKSDFDTLTQGLSEELVELATDMNPGSGWVIGNEELCDYCDSKFVCNQITTSEYVNSWYSNKQGKCWKA